MRVDVRLACCLLTWIGIGSACKAAEPVPTVGFYKLDDQRLTGETTVIANDAGFSDLSLLVAVDAAGKVIEARPVDNFEKLDPTPALEMVRKWTFRPQTFDGKPVNAVGMVSITYKKREIPADTAAAFPVGPPADTTITLERGACYGSCPDYRVTVHGNGLVEFDTGDDHLKGTAAQIHLEYNGHNVLLPGRHTAHIDPAAVAHLLNRFRSAHFFGLRKEYVYGATDNPTQVLTVRVGKTSKKVTDYIGTMAGMPQEVRDLEHAVDAVAGTARWVTGDPQTLAELDAAHFNYQSRDGAMLAVAAARKFSDYQPVKGTEALLLGLIDRGVPLDTKLGGDSLATMLIRGAAIQGSEPLFDKLVARGVVKTAPRSTLTQAFNHLGCSPPIAHALDKTGADPHATGDQGTALTALRGAASTCGDHPEKLLDMARTLIELGVPLEARDSLGWTALMGCDSPALAQLLLAHGANPQAHDEKGTTPLLSTDDDRVALILLRAGAGPKARNEGGSVRAQAIKYHMPATLAWLDAHGIR